MIFLKCLCTLDCHPFFTFQDQVLLQTWKKNSSLICKVPNSNNSKSLPFQMSLPPSLPTFDTVADTTKYSKCTKHPYVNFVSITFSSTNKKPYPLHLTTKNIQTKIFFVLFMFVLLSFLGQKAIYFSDHCPQKIYPFSFFHILKLFQLCQLGIRSPD